ASRPGAAPARRPVRPGAARPPPGAGVPQVGREDLVGAVGPGGSDARVARGGGAAMTTPAVPVLMPAYNAGRYIGPAIESIRSQSFDDFEFIIVADGSTDDTRAIIERHAAADPRIRAFSRPNTGLVGARNDTLAPARGEFLAFL